MLRRTIEIIGSSFKMALQELWKNKLRTFLSLFGITIGIFCIIGVLATVNSLEHNIQNEVKGMGTNTIFIDKWDYTGGPDFPYWKYVNRPYPSFDEAKQLKQRTYNAAAIAFVINTTGNVEYRSSVLSNVNLYGVSEEYHQVQSFEVNIGRYLNETDFTGALNNVVIGYTIAEKLFGIPEAALNKEVSFNNRRLYISGITKKQGKQMIGGWDFDQSIIIPYQYAKTIINERRADPMIIVKGKENISSVELKDELTGTMRAIRKLSPTKEENFTLNDVNDLSSMISDAFVGLNIGGWAIAALSLIVGMFGVANIMFVTVRERTSQIGLKKALGAKKSIILTEFLLESAFLCIIGGLIGLSLVYVLTLILTQVLNFPVFISPLYMGLTIGICILVGIFAGFIPARQAANMNPVTAIRS